MNSDVSRKYVSMEIAEKEGQGKARRARESDEARGDKGRENTPETVRREKVKRTVRRNVTLPEIEGKKESRRG